jgi:hypothetical protein
MVYEHIFVHIEFLNKKYVPPVMPIGIAIPEEFYLTRKNRKNKISLSYGSILIL